MDQVARSFGMRPNVLPKDFELSSSYTLKGEKKKATTYHQQQPWAAAHFETFLVLYETRARCIDRFERILNNRYIAGDFDHNIGGRSKFALMTFPRVHLQCGPPRSMGAAKVEDEGR